MKIFVHFKQQKLEELMKELILIHSLYVQSSYELEGKLLALLADAQRFYKQIGETKSELKIVEIGTYLQAAKSGTDPQTLLPVKTGRRSLLRSTYYSCLAKLSDQFSLSINQVDFQLKEGDEMVSNVILSILQSEVMSMEQLATCVNVEQAKVLWEELREDKQISLVDKKLKMTLIEEDISLLITNCVRKLI